MSSKENKLRESKNSRCVACLLPLRPGARRCPHCQSVQRPQRWQLIGDALKWIGGITALLSLFLLALQVNNVISTYTDRQESIEILIRASDLRASAGDYTGAWGLLDQAFALEAGSNKVQTHRVDLAMLWVRNFTEKKEQSFGDLFNPLLPSLYLGAVRSSPSERADALAHIGWLNIHRRFDEDEQFSVDEQFDTALAADPDNVFANTWRAAWLLISSNNKKYGNPSLDLARKHFDTALATGQRRQWIRKRQLYSYLGYKNAKSIEGLAVAASMKAKGEALPDGTEDKLQSVIFNLVNQPGPEEDAWRDAVLKRFSWNEIRELYIWASLNSPDISRKYPIRERYMFARFTEWTGEPAMALTLYRSMLPEVLESGYPFKRVIANTISRLESTVGED